MDLNLTLTAAGLAGILLLHSSFSAFASWRTRRDLRNTRIHSSADMDALRNAVQELQAEVSSLKESFTPTAPIAGAPTAGRRAEALEMLHRGADARSVSQTLDIPEAETILLGRVHQFLECAAVDAR